MGKINDFFICGECGESLIERYENGELEMKDMGYCVAYECPFCGTINKSKPLEEG